MDRLRATSVEGRDQGSAWKRTAIRVCPATRCPPTFGGYQRHRRIAWRAASANTGWQRDLSVSHTKVGDVRRAQGNLDAAGAAYRRAQEYDYIIMGSNSGIRQWDDRAVAEAIVPMTRRLSVTNHGWMMPYSMLGYTKVPEEQGEWAAEAALRIIAGTRPADIPIVPNHKWDIWTNTRLLEAADIALPRDMLAASHKVP